jgi:elongation factor Ts
MKVDFVKLKKLRSETDSSIALCNKALIENDNDYEKAKTALLKMGLALADKKIAKETTQGVVASYIHHNHKMGAILILSSETDFVAKNAQFQNLASEIAMQITSMDPQNVAELLAQDYIRDNSKKIADLIKEYISKLGENIQVKSFTRYSL